MRFLKNLFTDDRKDEPMFSSSEKAFLNSIIIDKIVAQQALEGSMPTINALPKGILKKLEKLETNQDDIRLPNDFDFSATFDAVVFYNGKHEVGRINLEKK